MCREASAQCLTIVCVQCPDALAPRQLLLKEDWPHEDEVEDQLKAMCMVAQLMNVMVCYKHTQSGAEASQRTQTFISRTLKPHMGDTRAKQDRAIGNSPADGATPSSPEAGPNTLGSGSTHDSQEPVADAKTVADSITFDSDLASANTVGAASGTHACSSPTSSTKSRSLGTAASNSESVKTPDIKATANDTACCGSERTSSSARQDPSHSGPERKAAASDGATAVAKDHIHFAMIALSALHWTRVNLTP